jgi:hypothetical protein
VCPLRPFHSVHHPSGAAMKKALLGVVVGLVGSATGCSLLSGPDDKVMMSVATIEAPASIDSDASLSVVLSVVAGPCTDFDRFETNRDQSGATIVAWGRNRSGEQNDNCEIDIALVQQRSVRFDPPFGSTFTVTVVRPHAERLTATVQIRASPHPIGM